MVKDITIGQYFDTQSPIHKMDPRTKILWTVFYMITLFVINGIWSYLAVILLTAIIIKLSNIPVKFIGVGEKLDDMQEFDQAEFVKALFE